MMGIQSENQKKLNKQGQSLQMQTWRDTGYGAQMAQMREAGVNPALMYGMSGGGGQTTGGQGGGSAQSGSSHAPMDIGAIAQVGLMQAQAEKLKAETKNIDAGTGKVGQDISESQQRVKESIGRVALNEKQGITEESKAKLNGIIGQLNEEGIKKAISEIKLNNEDLKWMAETGLNRNDSVVTKSMQYLVGETGLSAKTILFMIGGMKAFESVTKGIGNLIPLGKVGKMFKQ